MKFTKQIRTELLNTFLNHKKILGYDGAVQWATNKANNRFIALGIEPTTFVATIMTLNGIRERLNGDLTAKRCSNGFYEDAISIMLERGLTKKEFINQLSK